jgi:hypothetical protein
MYIWKILRKPVLTAAAAVVLSAGAWTGLAKADGEFLEPFPPDYPTGGVYTTVRGLIIGGPGDNTTRCSADLEAGQLSAVGIAQAAQAVAQLVCDAAPPGSEVGACFPVTAVNLALAAAEFQAGACALQDGLIDSAEIEAGFENTVKLIDLNTKLYETQLEVNLLNCTAVVGFILPEADGGLAEWVAMFVQDRIDQYTPIISDPLRIVEAQDRLNQGNVDFGLGNFEDAYSGYCKGYGRLVAGKGKG